MAQKKTKDKDIKKASKQKILPKPRPDDDMKLVMEMAKDSNVMGYNASLAEYKNNPSKALDNPRNLFYPPNEAGEKDIKRAKLIDKIRGEKVEVKKEDIAVAKGGSIEQQMELFQEGGLKDEGNTVDPVSGNEVPPGSNQEEVRDDIPAQLSEGEFVFPADVVRYIGLEKLMVMRQEAKAGLKRMEEMGQMGNSDEATLPDDMPFKTSSEEDNVPFTMEDLDTEEETEYNQGGVVKAQAGTFVANNPNIMTQPSMFQNQNLPSSNITQPVNYNVPNIPTAPVGGFTPKFSGQVGQTGQQGKAPTFQTLLGQVPGQYDEMREYINEAGMKLQIPFKNGEPIYPIPEGYSYVDPEATKAEEVTTKEVKPQTARVVEEQGGDDLDNRVKEENVKNYGVENPTVISLGGEIDKNSGKVISTKNSPLMDFSINIKPEGGLLSASMPVSLFKAVASIATGRSMVGDKDIITITPKGHASVKVELTGKEFKNIVNITDDSGKVKTSITNPKVQNFLRTRVNDAIAGRMQKSPSGEVITAGDLTKKRMADYMKDLGKDRDSGIFDNTPTLAGAPSDFRSDDFFEGGGDDYSPSFGGQPEISPASDLGVGESEDDDAPEYRATGGLAGKKKKKPKVKNMKRGGLASR